MKKILIGIAIAGALAAIAYADSKTVRDFTSATVVTSVTVIE